MLTLLHNGISYPIQDDTYYRTESADGMDSLTFSMSIRDELYPMIAEQESVTDEEGNRWLVKKIDGGSKTAKIVCEIDLDEWREEMHLAYYSDSVTVANLITSILPDGWSVYDRSGVTIKRTTEGDALTSLEIAQTACSTYSVYLRFDTARKQVTIYTQTPAEPLGSFATRDLNLKEINYKGDSSDFATRLYAYGKDNLSFADINDGKAYVDDNTYSDRVISAYWKDERYTDADSLLTDAKLKLYELAHPVRSYECSIVDLQATNPEKYNNLDFSLFTSALLVDDAKQESVAYQVVEREVHPNYPEENVVTFSSTAAKITKKITQVSNEITNPNSDYNQERAIAIANATNWLTSSGGYVIAVKNDDGSWKELLFMDTDNTETAKNVLRINENGIGFSTTGVNGPFGNAWTIDGKLVADYITTGTLNADLIKAGVIQDEAGSFYLDMENGTLKLKNATFASEGDQRSVEMKDGQYFVYYTADGETHEVGRLGASFVKSAGTKGLSLNADEHCDWLSFGIKDDETVTFSTKLQYTLADAMWRCYTNFRNDKEFACYYNGTKYGGLSALYQTLALNIYKDTTKTLAVYKWSGTSGSRMLVYDVDTDYWTVFGTWFANYIEGSTIKSPYVYGKTVETNYLINNSDRRLKDNIEALDEDRASAFVLALKPSKYVYKSTPNEIRHGFIAQDVQDIEYGGWSLVMETPNEDEEGNKYLGIGYLDLIADMVATIQSQHKRITDLEERLAKIEEALNADD